MKYEQSVSIYSVARVKYSDVDRLKAYLYDHTTASLPGYSIADSMSDDGRKIIAVILKTTVTHDIEHEGGEVCGNATLDRALYLANYQNDRLASGGIFAKIAGSRVDAENRVVEMLT